MTGIPQGVFDKPYARYSLSVAVVAASFFLRHIMVQTLGPGVPTYITFYPPVILAAILGGFWPGVLATVLVVLGTDYLILPPVGTFAIATTSDFVTLSYFALMGALISLLAEHYRRSQLAIAAYKAEQTLWLSNQKLDVALSSMKDAVFISDAEGEFIHINDAFAAFHRFKNKSECPRKYSDYPEFLELFTPDGEVLPPDMWPVPRALRGETGTNIEFALRSKDTGEHWIGSYNYNPLRDSKGSIIGTVVVGRDITESKKAEEKLRDSELRYRNLFNSMEEGFCIIQMLFDAEGKPVDYRFLEVNRAFEKQTGLHDAVGKRIEEIAPSHEDIWAEFYGKVALTGRSAHMKESRSLNRFFEVRAYRVGAPELRQVAIIFNDISERKRAEEHIRRLMRVYSVLSDTNQTIVREKDSRAMMETVCRIAVEKGKFRMAWIGMINPETHLVDSCASSGAVDGYLDRVSIDLQNPDFANGPVMRCVNSGQHAICNDIENDPFYLPWRDEALQRGYRSSGGFPLKIEGKVVGVLCLYASELAFFDVDELHLLDEMAMDISFALEVNRNELDRRKKEEELRWKTAFLEAQVDSALDGILVVSSEGKKLLQNQRMNALMKIPRKIVENPDDRQQREFAATQVKNPEHFIEKINYINAHPQEVLRDEIELLDGTILDRYSSPVHDKAGHHYGRIWNFRDITERRQLEEQFRQAQKMEAIGQLTGGIAHDFNNLLTVILGCSEILADEVRESPRLSKMAEVISDVARRGAELTHRMLAFARRQTLQPRPVNINDLLSGMESFLRRTLSADIDLQIIHGCLYCDAIVDPTQLESALLNLCVNARDAMPEGGSLTIETADAVLDADYAVQNPDVTPGDYILIAVSDSGCGISEENMERVFDPFFTTKDVGKGTGLGLSMVYGFVKQSQGHVKIYSEPGHGTSVKIYLPRANQKSEPAGPTQTQDEDINGSEVVLLVEDNPLVRKFAKSQLLYFGYQVLEAANGNDALDILKERTDIDLLFTDMVMPGGMNGYELSLEACKLHPKLKVLYCSGYAENAIHNQKLPGKNVRLLNKPYTRLELARTIRRVLATS
jgi:PAS domain S-box-containing protein